MERNEIGNFRVGSRVCVQVNEREINGGKQKHKLHEELANECKNVKRKNVRGTMYITRIKRERKPESKR